MRRLLGRPAFRVLLATLGVGLQVVARCNGRFRDQVTTDLVIEVSSRDGAAQHYVFRRADRSVVSRSGRAPGATDLALEFESGWLGVATLVRPDAIGVITRLLHARRATYTGNAAYVLWFWGLTRMVLPYGRERRVPGDGFPGALRAPNADSKVAGRITREPVTARIDPAWTTAVEARARMAMLRGSAGDDIPMW